MLLYFGCKDTGFILVTSISCQVKKDIQESSIAIQLFFRNFPMAAVTTTNILDVWHLGDMAFDGTKPFST